MKIVAKFAHCHVSGSHECEAPAGYKSSSGACPAPRQRNLWECDQCGNPVCSHCSVVIGGVLLCELCEEENDKETRR